MISAGRLFLVAGVALFAARLSAEPILHSTYLGGSGADSVDAVAVDPRNGDIVVAGHTFSTTLPHTAGGAQPQSGGGVDGFVARFDPQLKTLLNATYLGGSGGEEILGLAVHPLTGDVYVAGFTTSNDFPGTVGRAQPENAGFGDGFVARFDPTLTQLRGSTYFGGATRDKIVGIAIDAAGTAVFVAGITDGGGLPGTAGGALADFGGSGDGFLARFDPTLTQLGQATYLPGGGTELVRAMAIHPKTGEILVGGQSGTGDVYLGFLARVDSTLTGSFSLLTVDAGPSADVFGIAVDPLSGDIYATGWVHELAGTEGGAQPQPGGGSTGTDDFVVRIDPTMTTELQATYLGGSENDYGRAIAIHPGSGDVYVTGQTYSADFPGTSSGAQSISGGSSDGFVARLDPTLTRLVQSTYLGAIGDDVSFAVAIPPSSGEIVVAGATMSSDFPESFRGAQPEFAGGDEFFGSDAFFGGDGFVARLTPSLWDPSHECQLHPGVPCLNGREPDPVDVPHSPRLVTRPGKTFPLALEPSPEESAP